MKTFEQWLKEEGLDGFPGTDPALINAMHRGWNAAMAERQKPLSDNEMLDWNERALQVAEQQRQATVKESLAAERHDNLPHMTPEQISARAKEFARRCKAAAADAENPAEQPEDEPVAHLYRNISGGVEVKLLDGAWKLNHSDLYSESVKAERDALREQLRQLEQRDFQELARANARVDRAINELRALREERRAVGERVKELEALYSELLYQVAQKIPGETRHETALRQLRSANGPRDNPPGTAMQEGKS